MFKNFYYALINTIVKHSNSMNSAALEKPLVPFKNLIKDIFTENMKLDDARVMEHSTYDDSQKTNIHLKQSFQKTVNKPLANLRAPFLLVPLFKIQDSKGNPINYKFFENIDLNKLYRLTNGEYFIQFPHTVGLDVLSVELQERGLAVDLIHPLMFIRRGILIFKDPCSDSAMIYLGVFINEDILNIPQNALGKVYNKYIFNDNPCFGLLEHEQLSLSLKLHFKLIEEEYKFILGFFGANNEKHYYKFNLHPGMVSMTCYCTVTLSPVVKEGQLFFEVNKSFETETLNEAVFIMNFDSSAARRYYEEFIENQEGPMEEGASAKDSDKDSGNDSDVIPWTVEDD